MSPLWKLLPVVASVLLLTACTGQSAGSASTSPLTASPAPSSVGPTAAVFASATPTAPVSEVPVATETPVASDTPTAGETTAAAGDAAGDEEQPLLAQNGVLAGANLARAVSAALAKVIGREPESMTCPDLDAKVDATTTCTLTDSGFTYAVPVLATDVNGDVVTFTFRVD